MKKFKKTELQLNKEIITALNQDDLNNLVGGKESDMWVTKDRECRTTVDGCPSKNTTCYIESIDICVQTKNNCLPVQTNGCVLTKITQCNAIPSDTIEW